MKLTAINADITTLNIDVIVNAANQSLLVGGGVDGAIHRAAGPKLLQECRTLGGCNVGDAKITAGYNLPAKYIIHTVGPIWRGGTHHESELLENCYQKSLQLAIQYDCHSIAFPCISTGVYRFPKELAANIAINSCRKYLSQNSVDIKILFTCFSEDDLSIYNKILVLVK